MSPAPEVIFMCGPSGSGKSTLAARYEAEGKESLSFDVEAWRSGVTEVPAPAEAMARIETRIKRRLLDLVKQGRDVVLDFPFSTRAMRLEYRELLAGAGVIPLTVYLEVDYATVVERLAARSSQHPDDLVVAPEVARAQFDAFEPPDASEGPLRVIANR